jgi:hypothetical protein
LLEANRSEQSSQASPSFSFIPPGDIRFPVPARKAFVPTPTHACRQVSME